MAITPQSVKLNNIYLDLNNPRHDPQGSELDAIQLLIENENIRTLAKHISQIGSTSPLDLMALVPHPKVKDSFITAEGNRRLCALKLLKDPDKAAKDVDKRYFRKLQQEMDDPIKEVLAVKFLTMEAARPWVELRHDAPAGVGTKTWDAEEKARFNTQGKANTPNARALEIIDYAKRHQLLPDDELQQLVITTLTRYLSTPDVRSALGITSANHLEINVATDEFEQALVKFLRDSVTENSAVNSRSNADARKAYAEDLRTRGYSPTTREKIPYVPRADEINAADNQTSVKTAPSTKPITIPTPTVRNKRSRDKDRFVIPSGFIAKVTDPVFRLLFKELRTLDAQEFAFSATYLLRAIIEQAAYLFLKKHNVQPIPELLHHKLEKVSDLLNAEGFKGKGMNALRKMASDKDSKYSPDTIGNFVHGGAVPTGVYAFNAWDTFEPIMSEIVRQLTQK